MWNRIIERAIENIIKAYGSKRAFGKEVGQYIAGTAISAIAVYSSIRVGQSTISLTPVKKLYVDSNGKLNDEGHGHLFAVVYEGNDGIAYKNMGQDWYQWNVHDWV